MTINWTDPGFSESHLRGYYESPWSFEETVARLVTASGQPINSFDEYKSSVNFVGTFEGQRFTLYDYKEDRAIHIGGNDELDISNLVVALTDALNLVEPTPYKAKEYYADQRGHEWSED